MGRRVLGAVLGLIAGAALAVFLAVAAGWLFQISQAEGAYAMAVAFFWVPLGMVTGTIAGAILAKPR